MWYFFKWLCPPDALRWHLTRNLIIQLSWSPRVMYASVIIINVYIIFQVDNWKNKCWALKGFGGLCGRGIFLFIFFFWGEGQHLNSALIPLPFVKVVPSGRVNTVKRFIYFIFDPSPISTWHGFMTTQAPLKMGFLAPVGRDEKSVLSACSPVLASLNRSCARGVLPFRLSGSTSQETAERILAFCAVQLGGFNTGAWILHRC